MRLRQESKIIDGDIVGLSGEGDVVCSAKIDNGIARPELGLTGTCTTILVTRMVKDKRVVEYLQAARCLKKRNRALDFLLVGTFASEGKQAISREEIERYKDSVHYLGRRSDIAALLAISDIFVLPSYYREGLLRVLLEAGAMGLGLITTDMPRSRSP